MKKQAFKNDEKQTKDSWNKEQSKRHKVTQSVNPKKLANFETEKIERRKNHVTCSSTPWTVERDRRLGNSIAHPVEKETKQSNPSPYQSHAWETDWHVSLDEDWRNVNSFALFASELQDFVLVTE